MRPLNRRGLGDHVRPLGASSSDIRYAPRLSSAMGCDDHDLSVHPLFHVFRNSIRGVDHASHIDVPSHVPVGVDVVLPRGQKTWGIEGKAASALTSNDGQGLVRLAARCGEDFESGVLLYTGRDRLPLADGCILAVPLSELWER